MLFSKSRNNLFPACERAVHWTPLETQTATHPSGIPPEPIAGHKRRDLLPRWVKAAVHAVFLGVALNSLAPSEAPAKDERSARRILDAMPHTDGALIKALDHDDYYVRIGARNLLCDDAVGVVRRTQKSLPDKQKFIPKPHHSAEQRRHLEWILREINKEEILLLIKLASIFEAPGGWEEKGHTESMSMVLRTLWQKTGQPLALHNTVPSFLHEQVPTQGLGGKSFWEALRSIKTVAGNESVATCEGNGSIYVHAPAYNRPPDTVVPSGPACLFVSAMSGNQINLRLLLEPKLQRTVWEMEKGTATDAHGAVFPLTGVGPMPKEIDSLTLDVPHEARGKVTVCLQCAISAKVYSTVAVSDLSKSQEFQSWTCVLAYHGVEQMQGVFAVRAGLRSGEEGIPHGLVELIGCTVLDADGMPQIPLKIEGPNPTLGGDYTIVVARKPHGVRFHIPTHDQTSATHTFTFPLQMKE